MKRRVPSGGMSPSSDRDKVASTRVDKHSIAPGMPDSDRNARLPLPHERDESVGTEADQSTGSMGTGAAGEHQRRVMEQARQDLANGQVDTDLRATPGQDAEQRKKVLRRQRG